MKDYHHLDASNLRFSVFSSKNLKALSVAKVVTPLVFDQLGHPLPGGLYDPKMGMFKEMFSFQCLSVLNFLTKLVFRNRSLFY